MAWLDNFLGTDDNSSLLDNKDVALDMLSSSKAGVGMLAATIVETTNPQLRQMLTSELTAAINGHFTLSDMAIQKGWYDAFSNPQQQISKASKEADSLIKMS